MAEPWVLKSNDSREENSIITFIIFCEDENDEPFYLRSFQIEGKLKVNAISNQGKAKINLNNTLVKCEKDGLIEFSNHGYKIKDGITENIWCVYDRDLENEDISKIRNVDDTNFTSSIQTAKSAGLKVAWSNDAFELWVLLHFESIPTGMRLHRKYIYERLSEIFKTIPSPSPELELITKNPLFNYKNNLKRKGAFIQHVLPILKVKMNTALLNARALEGIYESTIPFHDCNPCTMVHYLVDELLKQAL